MTKKPGEHAARWRLAPTLYRDTAPRQRAVEQLRRVVAEEVLIERTPVGDGSHDEVVADTELSDQAATVADRLASSDEDLTPGVLGALAEFVSAVRERHGEGPAAELVERLDRLHAHEGEQNPHERAGAALAARSRRSSSSEASTGAWTPTTSGRTTRPRLRRSSNLCHMAGVDYVSYRSIALEREPRDELQAMERAANATLAEKFEAWTEAKLSVEFRSDHEGLQLQVFDKQSLRNVPFDQRALGFATSSPSWRSWTATAATARPCCSWTRRRPTFTTAGRRTFARQSVAQTIIYTTHSIGCLPEDLGSTLRVVEPAGSERSMLRDSFWEGGAGLTPLMLAMGATALAFTPSRFALIGEGPSEAILLPSLMREARDERYADDPLGFQVAPGLALVARRAAAELELDAANVAYLHDADSGGRDHAAKLPERAHEERRVFELGSGQEEGLCLEDLVEADVYADAVKLVLGRTRESEDRIEGADLPAVGRPAYLRRWCKDRSLDELGKTHVAEEALRVAREQGRALVEPARSEMLRDLYEQLRAALGIPGAAA